MTTLTTDRLIGAVLILAAITWLAWEYRAARIEQAKRRHPAGRVTVTTWDDAFEEMLRESGEAG